MISLIVLGVLSLVLGVLVIWVFSIAVEVIGPAGSLKERILLFLIMSVVWAIVLFGGYGVWNLILKILGG